MNKIKPLWGFAAMIAVGCLWLVESSNRPDNIINHTEQPDHITGKPARNSSISYEQVSLPSADDSTAADNQVTENKTIQPVTTRMLVANRAEYFASVRANALPAQEQTLLVDMGREGSSESGVRGDEYPVAEKCPFNDCDGINMLDY